VRYCIVRHVGFLIGRGNPAGSAAAIPETVADVIVLLERQVPDPPKMREAFDRLESTWLTELPRPGTVLEADLFDELTIMFVTPRHSGRARAAIRGAVGDTTFELLTAYLAFVRTAHFWTEMHPELAFEEDCASMLIEHERLAELVLGRSEAELVRWGAELKNVGASIDPH
jgi:hypothetical protein